MGTHKLEKAIPLRTISYNIRYATKSPVQGEELWKVRLPHILAQLLFITAGQSAFICLQEALANQLADIQAGLGPSWAYIGIGRDDGKKAGEFSPIFYNTNTWELERSKTYWLSKTPEKPSTGWDAVLPRIVVMGQFRHRETGAQVVVQSTHFDHVGVKAREESAKLIIKLADSWVKESNSTGSEPPVFLAGDFNSETSDKAYQTMTAPKTGMTDISSLISKHKRYGNEMTYTSFGEPGETPKRIDFLFVKDPADMKFLTFGVLSNRFDDGVFMSDHRPIVADMEIPVRGQRFSGSTAQSILSEDTNLL